jgi:hypothetical protein
MIKTYVRSFCGGFRAVAVAGANGVPLASTPLARLDRNTAAADGAALRALLLAQLGPAGRPAPVVAPLVRSQAPAGVHRCTSYECCGVDEFGERLPY